MPFFSKKMIQLFCSFSDELRRDKKIFKDIVDELGVNTPIATKSANEAVELILRNPAIVTIFKEVLSGNTALEFFPETFIQNVLKNLKSYNKHFYKMYRLVFHANNRLQRELQESVLKNAYPEHKLSYNLIALRMFIFIRMYNLLNENQ